MLKKIIEFLCKLINLFKTDSGSSSPGQVDKPQSGTHVEKETVCDGCEYLNECLAAGNLIDITVVSDDNTHHIVGPGSSCKVLDAVVVENSIKDVILTLKWFEGRVINDREHAAIKSAIDILTEAFGDKDE